MRKFFTENRVLAFIQIGLALGGGWLVIAVINSLANLDWLYLAAIFCFVSSALAAGLYRVVGQQKVATVSPSQPLQRREPSVYEQLAQLQREGEQTRDEITWQRMGRSLRLNKWRLNVRSFIYSHAPEYHDEIAAFTGDLSDDLELHAGISKLIKKIMSDSNYRNAK
jgi:hypothetical protein